MELNKAKNSFGLKKINTKKRKYFLQANNHRRDLVGWVNVWNSAIKITITGKSDLKLHSNNLSHQTEFPRRKKQEPYKIVVVGAGAPTREKVNK